MSDINLEVIEYNYCSNCKNRRPGKSTDCSIYQAVFVHRNEYALKSVEKLFKGNVCQGFMGRDSL